VATALLVAGSTLTFWIPPFASTSCTQASFKTLGCSCNCRLPINARITWWPRRSIDRAMAAKTKT